MKGNTDDLSLTGCQRTGSPHAGHALGCDSQGHFQIMFNWQHCPLFQSKLSWPMRIMYSSGVWSYIVGAISTPTFIIIPAVTIWFGVFPIVVSRWTALGVTVYYFATNMVRLFRKLRRWLSQSVP